MIDSDLIERNAEAQLGLKLLAESGVLEAQVQRLTERLGSGDPDESEESLVKEILKYRNERRAIESLRHLGAQFVKKGDDND